MLSTYFVPSTLVYLIDMLTVNSWFKQTPLSFDQVLVGFCVMKTEEEEGASAVPPPNTSGPSIHPKTDLPVDTITDSTKTRFYKVAHTHTRLKIIEIVCRWQHFDLTFPSSA